MCDNQDPNKQIQYLKTRVTECEKEIAALKGEETLPRLDTMYYLLNSGGAVCSALWEGKEHQRNMLSVGNVFVTEAEAESEVQRRKVLVELKGYTKGFKPHGGTRKSKYVIYWDHADGGPYVGSTGTLEQVEGVFFASKEDALNAIACIGASRLKVLFSWT